MARAGSWSRRRLLQAAAVLPLLPRAAPAQPAGRTPSVAMPARGVNLAHWFAQSDQQPRVTPARVAAMGELIRCGFDHVRLGIAPRLLASGESRSRTLATLDQAIGTADQAGLAVILDLHPEAGDAQTLAAHGGRALAELWRDVAQALGSRRPERLVFEVMNEPEPLRGDAWWAIQEQALRAIRDVDPDRLVLCNPGGWSSPGDLTDRVPYADTRVVYTIHYYGPILFTHQGADWSWDVAGRVSGLDWPIPPAREADARNAAAASADRDQLGRQAAGGLMTEAAAQAEFARVARWQADHGGARIHLGEFGVYARLAPPEARLRWVASVRRLAERHGWGWAYWEDTQSFGLRQPDGRLDGAMLAALGLRSQP